jgi:hypothetical protein
MPARAVIVHRLFLREQAAQGITENSLVAHADA